MAFVPEPEFPDLTQLITSLNNSQISNKNPPLYQTIKGLIQKVQQLKGISQEEIEAINIQLTDLSNTINNLTTGTIVLPPPWMPVFDGEDGDDGFSIVGSQGPRGEDGKSIPAFCDCEAIEPPPLLPQCCVEGASEFSSSSTGTINDLDFANASILRFTGASAITITGIKAGRAGQRATILNLGGSTLRISDQDGGSSAANQFLCPSTRGQIIGDTGAINLVYDGTTAKWRPVAVNPGDPIAPAFNAGDFTAAGGAVWTVASGDVITFKYQQRDKTVTVWATIFNTDVDIPTSALQILIPNSFTCTSQVYIGAEVVDNGTVVAGYFNVAAGTSIAITRHDNANWQASAAATAILGQTTFEVN